MASCRSWSTCARKADFDTWLKNTAAEEKQAAAPAAPAGTPAAAPAAAAPATRVRRDRRGRRGLTYHLKELTAMAEPHAHAAATHDDHDHKPHGWRRWVFATNHKDIGTMYLIFAGTMFFIGGMMAMVIRAELFKPGPAVLRPAVLQLHHHDARASS